MIRDFVSFSFLCVVIINKSAFDALHKSVVCCSKYCFQIKVHTRIQDLTCEHSDMIHNSLSSTPDDRVVLTDVNFSTSTDDQRLRS